MQLKLDSIIKMVLRNKKILIISPQFWGKMLISKHHYAVELANRGNEVYFLNPPNAALTEEFFIDELDTENLYIIHHRLNFPYKLKFRSETIFHWFMKRHINFLIKKTKTDFDIVWSFDLGNLYPFKLFSSKAIKIFHPVDEPYNKVALRSAIGAEIIFSTTPEILKKYSNLNVSKYYVNHGLKAVFLEQQAIVKKDKTIRIGFSGNLLRQDIDREILINIITENQNLEFHIWGSLNIQQSNISGSTDADTQLFIKKLRTFKNTILHGVKTTKELAIEYQNMDAFLICYKVDNNVSVGQNYHKILEFMSTGKVIISHNFSNYRNQPDLVQMESNSIDNTNLSKFFKSIVSNLDTYNTAELCQARKDFARNNLYQTQIGRIEEYLLTEKLIRI